MCNITYLKFPCRIYEKKCIWQSCSVWPMWSLGLLKCNNLNHLDYRYLQNSNESWYCRECCYTIFPFNSLSSNKNFFSCCTNTDNNNNTHWIDLENDHNSSLSLKPSNLELLVNQFNNATPEKSNDPEKVCSSKYHIEEMHTLKYLTKINHSPCFI